MATITQRGPSAWRAMVRRKGEALTKTLDTEAEAVAWAEKEEARIVSGMTAAQIKRMPSGISVGELFDKYAREVSPEKGGAIHEIYRLMALGKMFTGLAVDLDGATLAEWRNKRLREVSAASVNRELNLISAVFTRAIKEWRLPMAVNPVSSIQRPRQPHARKRRVSDVERAAIITELGWDGSSKPDTRKQWVAWAFCVALETMMRQGEILALTWPNVHLDRKFCHLPTTKNGHPRNVPLSSVAVRLFGMLPQTNGRVVAMVPQTFKCIFRDATTAAGIADLHFHDTRREALTRTAKKLTNIVELAKASGHRDTRSLMVYFEPDVTETADKLG